MNILNKYVYKNLKLNKVRSIVTIIGITLSCALITALFCLITSFHKTMIDEAISSHGNRHVTFLDVPNNELDNIIYNKNIDSYYLNENIGYSILEGSKNDYKPYLHILGYDSKSLDSLENKLIEGRLPENDKEIIISEHILYDALVKYEVGDNLTLNTGKRILNGRRLNQNDSLTEEEEFITNETKKYKIVGIVPRLNAEDYSAPGYTVITKISDISNTLNISVLYKEVKDYKKITKDILNLNEKDNQYDVTYNTSLIKAQGSGFSDSTIKSIYMMGFILSVIIVVTSVFCIRNSFIISVEEKIKSYGMFSSIGATPKQIKKSVLFEGFILGIIGIIFGIIFGVVASYILIIIINILLGDSVSNLMDFNISVYGIIISIILSSITIYLSCIGSAKKASKSSEIETIKLTNNIKNKKIKENKLITKLFGVTGNVSYKNMKRNKSKFRVTIISITISILTFITLSTFIDIGFKSLNNTYKDLKFNIIVDSSSDELVLYIEEFDDIIKMDNISHYSYNRSMPVDTNLLKNQSISVFSVSSLEYKKFIKKIGYNYNNVKDKALIYNNYKRDNNGVLTKEKYFDDNLKEISINSYIESNKEKKKLDVIMIDSLPMGFDLMYTDSPIMILNEDAFDHLADIFEIKSISHELFINSTDSKKLNKKINEYKIDNNKDMYVVNIDEAAKQMKNMILLVSILLYGFISVIILIGITNIFNTITTSMNLRRREFAIMQSVGMSKKELSKLVLFESMLYGIKSLLYGLPLGILGSYLMYKSTAVTVNGSNSISTYNLPYTSIIISIIFTFIIIIFIMKLSLSKINKQNIIETIRNENI